MIGCILPISVNERDEIESISDCVLKPNLLVSSVAQVCRVEKDGQRERKLISSFQDHGSVHGRVARGIVDDQDLSFTLQQARGDAPKDPSVHSKILPCSFSALSRYSIKVLKLEK